jgi:hypothetical protein
MATILPAKQTDYSGIRRAAELIGRSFEQQQQMEADQAFRLKLLDEQYKRQEQANRQSADYAADLAATAEQGKLEYQSDINANIQRVMEKYSSGTPTKTVTTKTRQPDDIGGDTTVPRGQVQQRSKTIPIDAMQETTPIYYQGKPVYYTDAELLQKGMTDGFWNPKEHRVVTYAEEKNKRSVDLLNKQVESETSLIEQRKKSSTAEDLRAELIKAQTAGAHIDYKLKLRTLQLDTEARDTQDAISAAQLANIMTEGKYNDMTPEQQATIRATLRAKDPKSEDPNLRVSRLDKYKHFYNPQARETLQKFFASSLIPETQMDLEMPVEGQFQYKDDEGRVETATYLYDQIFKEYAQQGRFEEAQRLPNAIVQGMKMHTMDGALPIKLSDRQQADDGTPKLKLTGAGAQMLVSIKALMTGNFELPDPPLKDDERSMWEKQIPNLEAAGLRATTSDTEETVAAKLAGTYKALNYVYSNQLIPNIDWTIPRYEKTVSLASTLLNINPERGEKLVQAYKQNIRTNLDLQNKIDSYESIAKAQFSNIAMAEQRTVTYNLPNGGSTNIAKFPSTSYPEYFGDVSMAQVPTGKEIQVRETIGSLINDYKLDNGEYIHPTTLMEDLIKAGIFRNSMDLQRIMLEYSRRYNFKALPSISNDYISPSEANSEFLSLKPEEGRSPRKGFQKR